MFNVLGCIFQQHDLRLVVVAAILCMLACATALSMIARARAADAGRTRLTWLAGAGAVAGCGIWGTHFVAMLAYHAGLPIAFAPGLTILSAVIAMSLCGAGFATALFVNGVLGGMITGIAISAMHYTGMAAVEIPAYAVWDVNYVIASVLIGVSLSGLALHYAVRRKSRRDYVLGAGLFLAAIVGLHFTAMTAVRYVPDGNHAFSGTPMNPFALAVVVAAGAAFIVAQALIVAVVDRHLEARAKGEAQRMRDHIAQLEAAQQALTKTSQDLSVALEAAQAASKSKSAFLASMSHELRTPLNAVLGFSETMLYEAFGPLGAPRYKEYLTSIHESGAHLLSLINDILDIARFDSNESELQEEVFELAPLIAQCLRMVAGHAEKCDIALSAEVAPALPALRADQRRIKQVLINLLSNAVKFTPAGGQVKVSVHLAEGGLAIAVADTGIGIAPQDIPKALERFGQVDSSLARKYEGTGLGLPLSKQLMELHGGSLALESEAGVGTTVTVILPPDRLVPQSQAIAAA
ncbi:MAG TPA: MHYT domain-containing protein [Rhizomicrobium sp.]|nr:MHYT domain-containing protein [Rhizomicrobium sp.]